MNAILYVILSATFQKPETMSIKEKATDTVLCFLVVFYSYRLLDFVNESSKPHMVHCPFILLPFSQREAYIVPSVSSQFLNIISRVRKAFFSQIDWYT